MGLNRGSCNLNDSNHTGSDLVRAKSYWKLYARRWGGFLILAIGGFIRLNSVSGGQVICSWNVESHKIKTFCIKVSGKEFLH